MATANIGRVNGAACAFASLSDKATGTLPNFNHRGNSFMRSNLLKMGFAILVLSLVSASALAQGRGRGRGWEKRHDVFANGNSRFDGRGRNQNWKCGVFVNCHDARDGRWDGRGPRANNNFSRGSRVSYRNRYNMSDYWRQRHVTSLDNRWRYRNRTWRNR